MESPSRAANPPLSAITSLRLGGPAGQLIEATSEDAIIAAVRGAESGSEPLLILGGGSNVVVADEGFPGTVLLIRNRGIEFEPSGAKRVCRPAAAGITAGPSGVEPNPAGRSDGARAETAPDGRVRVRVAAGEVWDDLVRACLAEGLTGIECLSGIPGMVGATPIQNVGAYGQEVADTIVLVRAFDRQAGEIVELEPAACEFGYRDSVFKRRPGRWVVLRVDFELERSELSRPIRYAELAGRLGRKVGERAPLAEVRETVLALRRGKGLLNEPGEPESATAGSFFTNPIISATQAETLRQQTPQLKPQTTAPPLFPQPEGSFKTSAAWLIHNAGFEPGYGDPEGIAISSRHCLVLTNRGGGDTAALMRLAHEIADRVREKFGIELHPEPNLVGVEW